MSMTLYEACEQRTTTQGERLRFQDCGSGQVPIVLLRGLFGVSANWQPVMWELAEHYRFLALQLPIDPDEVRRQAAAESLDELTAHVAHFLDELGFDRAVLCGNSLGGQVALEFTLCYPERVDPLPHSCRQSDR